MGNRTREAGLTDQPSRGVVDGQQEQVPFPHISCGQGTMSQADRHLPWGASRAAEGLSGCSWQQLMKTFGVTAGEARTRSISLLSKQRNNVDVFEYS